MNPAAWTQLRDHIPPGTPLPELERQLARDPALTEDERAALWLYAWARAGATDEAGPHLPRGRLVPFAR